MESELLTLQDALAGAYSLERELGRGGMGIVYLAREVQLDRLVAIKVLPAALAVRPDVRARFLREARTAASLSHPNIVPIHSVGEAGGLPYFVMTYVDGPSLGERLRERGPVPPSTMTDILRDVAHALGYAHSRGVVHRDVKPDNILLDNITGRAMVTDFGIASLVGDAADDGAAGTVEFMSPEQLRGEPADARSDLFAVGVVAHLALSGALPESGERRTELPAALAVVVDRCLVNDPQQRFASAESLVAALDTTRLTVARSALPPELRAWANEPAPFLALYGWMSLLGLHSLITTIGMALTHSDSVPVALRVFGLAFTALPLVPIMLFQARKTRRTLAAGYRLADLRFALRAWISERRAAIDANAAIPRSPLVKFAAALPLVFMTTALLTAALPSTFVYAMALSSWSMYAALATVGIFGALGLPTGVPSLQRELLGSARSWLWNSRLGEWLARRLTPKRDGVPLAAFRPTEMALNLAIEDLFGSLPEQYRGSLGELPAVARRLTERVTELREQGDRLLTHGAAASAVKANATQLTETVTALERLRLGLLRLHGGLADLRPLTTALALAKSLDRDITHLVDAQDEVTLAFERRTPSPA